LAFLQLHKIDYTKIRQKMNIPLLVEKKIREYIRLIYFNRWIEKIISVNKDFMGVASSYNPPDADGIWVEYKNTWSPYNYRDLQTHNNYQESIYTLKKNIIVAELPKNY